MAAVTLTENALHKLKIEYHGKFGHNIFWIQNISIVKIIDIIYTDCRLRNQTLAPTPVSLISVNHTKIELTILIVQTAYSVYNNIRELILIMIC